jgi:hypothetical protein
VSWPHLALARYPSLPGSVLRNRYRGRAPRVRGTGEGGPDREAGREWELPVITPGNGLDTYYGRPRLALLVLLR